MEKIPKKFPFLDDFENALIRLLESKKITFNGDFRWDTSKYFSPTDIQQIYSDVAEVCRAGAKAHTISMWVLGNIAHVLKRFPTGLEMVVEATEQSFYTINRARRTYECFQGGRYGASFAHHAEAAHMKDVTHEAKHKLVELSAKEGWSIYSMRKIAQKLRALTRSGKGIPTKEATLIQTIYDAHA